MSAVRRSQTPLGAVPMNGNSPKSHRIFSIPFSKVYPLYVQKAERKGRTKKEVDEIITWLKSEIDLENFFARAPQINPGVSLIKGVVCGIRVEEIDDPATRPIPTLHVMNAECRRPRDRASMRA